MDSCDSIRGGTELDLMGPEAFLLSATVTAVFSLLDELEDEEAMSAGPKIKKKFLHKDSFELFMQKFLLSYDSFPCTAL